MLLDFNNIVYSLITLSIVLFVKFIISSLWKKRWNLLWESWQCSAMEKN